MSLELIVTLGASFMFVALVSGYGASALVSAIAPERRRLRQLTTAGPTGVIDARATLIDTVDPRLKRLPGVPKSPKELGRLRRRLARAGYTSMTAVLIFAAASIVTPVALGLVPILLLGAGQGLILGLIGGAIGYLLPS